MNREDFLSLLIRAVKEQFLTEQEASALLKRFDAGELEVSDTETPLDLREAITPVTDEEVNRALVSLLALGTLAYLHLRRSHFREVVQDGFIEKVKGLAKARAVGKLALGQWQGSMGAEVRSHVIQQVAVGAGRVPKGADVTEAVSLQDAYLSRWADEQAVKAILDEPLSELGMMARAALYAGAGRAEGYKAEAELYPEGGAVTYTSLDSETTCQSCLDAEGTYSLSEPFPVPPEVCEGLSNCRCTLTFHEVAA